MARGIGDLFLYLSTLGFLTFGIGFGTLVPWYHSNIGRHMMVFMSALGIIVTYAAAYASGIIGHSDVGRVAVWAVVACMVWWRIVLFAKLWYKAREDQNGQ
mgnify:FL=1